MLITGCKPEHLESICDLNLLIQRLHATEHPDIFKSKVDKPALLDDFKKVLADSGQYLLVALGANEEVLGYVWAQYYERSETPLIFGAKVLHINHICVRPENKRKGIGHHLSQKINQLSKTLCVDVITLDVWCFNNAAEEFFSKEGFNSYSNNMWKRN